MRNRITFLLSALSVIFVFSLPSFAQAPEAVWSHTYLSSSAALSLYELPDSGFVLGGYVNPEGESYRDMLIVRTDANGDTLWTKAIGESGRGESGACLYPTADGGFVLVGSRDQDEPYSYMSNVYLVKTDQLGDPEWSSTFGGTGVSKTGVCVAPAIDGGYMVAGYYWDSPTGWDIWLLKTDSVGILETPNHVIWSDADYPTSICVTSDSGFALTGYTQSFDEEYDYDMYLLKLNQVGGESWSLPFGSADPYDEAANHICHTSDGGYLMCGYRRNTTTVHKDIYVVKTDSIGNVDWTSQLGGTYHDEARCCIETIDGGYAVSASWYLDGNWKTALIKYNSNGDTVWTAFWGDPENSHTPYGLVQTADHGYAVGGLMSGDVTSAYLVKFEPESSVDPFTFYDAYLELSVSDLAPAVDTLLISDDNLIGRSLLGLRVVLDTLIHPAVDELTVMLSHDEVDVTLVAKGEAAGGNFVGTVFADAAMTMLNGGQAPYTGTFRPQENLNAFAGMNPNGSWVLMVCDSMSGNDGTLGAWGITLVTDVVLDVESPDQNDPIPGYELSDCYPNPFNPVTTIEYEIPRRSDVVVEIFNALGQKVITLVEEFQSAGRHEISWNGRNDAGEEVSTGIYFYRLRAGDFCRTKKMVLLK
ncbi:MAG TPA: T9SS type A sorting domain-containing protein [candidate division Zixibacteria bacterium]|nr:T9SS type A sorting domain-containing protein [candidate division Zixibacteria bacterium]